MIVFLNGKFVPEQEALVSVFDRSFQYGDGLFETMLVANGVPFRWKQHLERLEGGAAFLGLTLPFKAGALREFTAQLISKNQVRRALLRLTLSRGVGPRGYSPRGAHHPTVVMSLHPAGELESQNLLGWNLQLASYRLPSNEPLAQLKHCNKLPQILARAEAEQSGADEALLRNTDGFLVEGASSNLFWIEQGVVHTPPLASGVLSGVTRAVVLELCVGLGLEVREVNVAPGKLEQAEGVLLSLSSFGIVQGCSLDGRVLRQSLITKRLHASYWETVRRETNEPNAENPT